MENFLMVKLSY
uniref:Uncharacterized protein n=1 Tax=Nymphaea colorata TaxID=210225 RepID=A0A5K0WIS5_9MAGN